jgi:hypothetical protein
VILAVAATLAIVVQDHAALRAAPRSSAPELVSLWQGELLEIRGQSAGYLKVYDYHRERGGYLRNEAVHTVVLTSAAAPELLAVLRFLRDVPGSEALGISYGAAYLRAAPAGAPGGEAFDAIARMAERLADRASGSGLGVAQATAQLDVVQQFGIHTRSFERNGRIHVCYDGELFRRVLTLPDAGFEERAHAALGLTRPDCVDPDLSPALRSSVDDGRGELLAAIADRNLTAMTRGRVNLRRATVWAAIAYERARTGKPAAAAAQRALASLSDVRADELGDDRRAEYLDAVVRVGAIRWAAAAAMPAAGPLVLTAVAGDPGQTCIALARGAQGRDDIPLVRRCTYGIVWMASAQSIAQGRALVVAVQPMESWRELWVFHANAHAWSIDVLSPGADDPEAGYVDFAGFVPGTKRLLIARELREHGRFHRTFEELRLDDLILMRQASAPERLPDFSRWQDAQWRRDTLALH